MFRKVARLVLTLALFAAGFSALAPKADAGWYYNVSYRQWVYYR